MCTSLCVDMCFHLSWVKCLVVEWLGHLVDVCLTVFKNCQVVLQSGDTVWHFHEQCKSFRCATSLSTLRMAGLLNFSHSNKCAVVSHYRLNWHFSNDWSVLAVLHVCGCHQYHFLSSGFQIFCTFGLFVILYCYIIIEFWEFFTYSGYTSFIRCFVNIFPNLGLLFHSLNRVFWRTEVINFDEAQLIKFLNESCF